MDTARARELLTDERDRLRRIREQTLGDSPHFGPEARGSVDPGLSTQPADAASQTFEAERDASVLGHVDEALGEIDAALERVADGTFGHCEECGRTIPDDRLEAVPATRFCVEHQQREEARTRAALGGALRQRG